MNRQVTWSAVFAFSLSAVAPLLEGCEKCSVNESPCANKTSFLICNAEGASERRWVERECPGIEPICQPEPNNYHSCKEGKPAALCGAWRELQIASSDTLKQVVRASDLNADGRTDLLVLMETLSFRPRLVRVMQRSDGSFDAPITVLPEPVDDLYVGDVDGDKRLDLVHREDSRLTLTLRTGQPDGSFSEPLPGRAGALRAFDLTDFDGDGKAELLATDDDEIVILGPPPDLIPRDRIKVARPPRSPGVDSDLIQSLVARDLDGDGRPELLAWIRWADPSSTPDWQKLQVFTRPDDAWMSDGRSWPMENDDSLFLADFNADAIPDRVSAVDPRAGRPRVFIATGDGSGEFKRHAAQQLPEGGTLWLGDFDADGDNDIVSVRTMISVLRGRGDGTLEAAESFRHAEDFVSILAVADMDGDGALDLIATDFKRIFIAARACLE